MDNLTHKSYNYSITITLLEDLHTGTGTGNIIVDAVQARDEAGIPVIDRHHFRGVLKDNALRLKELGIIEQNDIDTLFGKAGGQKRKLDCSSLRVKNKADNKDCLIFWDSTARQLNSRCPEDNSLRRIEYIKSGTRLKGSLSLEHVTDKEKKSFDRILKFTTRLGSDRTRGSGQIKIDIQKSIDENKTCEEINSKTIRLLLKNKEPLCIPTRGYAGNIIRTESYIPGRTLFAAICALVSTDTILKDFFSGKLKIGNAYPIPTHERTKDLIGCQLSLPMPANIHSLKQQAGEQEPEEIRWPHWASTANSIEQTPQLRSDKDIDLFAQQNNHSNNTTIKTSRPKGAVYLYRDESGNWRRYHQALTIRMRNKRGGPLDSLKIKDTELFSEQRIPANTYFLMDIHCTDITLLNKVLHCFSMAQGVKIGRSKAPIKIISKKPLEQNTSVVTENSNNNSLSIIASSDWIVRGDNLGYLTELNKKSLLHTFGITDKYAKLSFEARQETETQGSFNYATGLPKRPFEVIKRGSVFRFYGVDSSALYNELSKQTPIGERVTEGYGQFIINLPVKIKSHEEYFQECAAQQKKEKINREKKELEAKIKKQDTMEKQAEPYVDKYYKEFVNKKKSNTPSKKNWQLLKNAILNDDSKSAYCNIVSQQAKKIDNENNSKLLTFFYTEQKSNNLGKKLDDLFRNKNKSQVKSFLDLFEKKLYGVALDGKK